MVFTRITEAMRIESDGFLTFHQESVVVFVIYITCSKRDNSMLSPTVLYWVIAPVLCVTLFPILIKVFNDETVYSWSNLVKFVCVAYKDATIASLGRK